jgi:ribonuclease R
VATEKADVFISPNHIGQALNGDRVKIQVLKYGKSRIEGQVIEVIERERTQFVGTIQMHEKFAFLIPDNIKMNTDIYIPKEKLNGAKDKEKALVKITVWPKTAGNPYGEVIEVLGKTGSNDTEMISILCNNGIDYKFPPEVLTEAESVGMELDPEEIKSRRDFRNTTTITIDPVDARDFDDALSFRKLENGHFEIGVHIADVSHYVTPGSAMDVEALKRSNSVYLVDRVVPMLPEQLSNMACSLRPHEDKYSFSSVFEMDETGKVYSEWFGKTVIHSDRRFSYEEAQEIIEGAEGDFKEEIHILDGIAKTLRKYRLKNGALNIESEEMRFKLDEEGMPIEVIIKTSKDAHKLVEEFMLLANRKVAEFIGKSKKGRDPIPFVYRCHDKPDLTKIGLFSVFIDKFGYKLDFTNPDEISKSINKLLSDIRLNNEYSLIQTMAIRSMAKATYETTNIGHYGLAFENYTHFTSPIRRYADLVVHRIVYEELTSKKHRYGKELDDVCKRISRMERKAVDAERESTKYFQVLFVQDKIGEEFNGTVSGIAEFGMFVKMDDNQCEGMVAMNDIPGDRFSFDQDKFRIIGSNTKREYNFGDKVRVKIYEVHLAKRQIDLELIVE